MQANSRSVCQFGRKKYKEAQRLSAKLHKHSLSTISYWSRACLKLGNWQKFQKLHIHSFSLQRGREWACFPSMDSSFRDTDQAQFIKITIRYQTWPLPKVPEVPHMLSFYKLKGVKLELISLYGTPFRRYGPTFKIAVFGQYETWPLAKVPEAVHTRTFFLPQGVEVHLIFATRAAVTVVQADLQNFYIWK